MSHDWAAPPALNAMVSAIFIVLLISYQDNWNLANPPLHRSMIIDGRQSRAAMSRLMRLRRSLGQRSVTYEPLPGIQ